MSTFRLGEPKKYVSLRCNSNGTDNEENRTTDLP